jgi:hypothetical protein
MGSMNQAPESEFSYAPWTGAWPVPIHRTAMASVWAVQPATASHRPARPSRSFRRNMPPASAANPRT